MRHLTLLLFCLVCAAPAAAQPARGLRGALEGESPGQSVAAESLATLDGLLSGWTSRWDERKIISIIEDASDEELDAIVRGIDVGKLIANVDDHAWGRQNRTRLLGLLSSRRLDALSTEARAELVDALQRGPTTWLDERAIRNVITGTTGDDLTELKNLIDRGGDHRDLVQLVNTDVDNAKFRRQIEDHITDQAPETKKGLRLMSDIDDTLISKLKDERYPKDTVYPGVLTFQRELTAAGGHTVFVTARPSSRLGLVEDWTLGKIEDHGVSEASVLSGDLISLLSHSRMAKKKLANVTAYQALFPEYDYVFVGDSGQGDPILAAQLLEQGKILAGLIHNVTDITSEKRASYVGQGIVVFDTYAGAAVACYRRGLIDRAALGRIIAACFADLEKLELSTDQRLTRLGELTRDIPADLR